MRHNKYFPWATRAVARVEYLSCYFLLISPFPTVFSKELHFTYIKGLFGKRVNPQLFFQCSDCKKKITQILSSKIVQIDQTATCRRSCATLLAEGNAIIGHKTKDRGKKNNDMALTLHLVHENVRPSWHSIYKLAVKKEPDI